MQNGLSTSSLQILLDQRYATTTQIRRLEFADYRTVDAGTRATTRVLGRLWRNRLVYRLEREQCARAAAQN